MKKVIAILVLGLLLSSNAYAECIKGDCTNGYGTYIILADGGKYVGEWKDSKQHGQGTMTFPDGIKIVGEFKDGLPNGQGTWTHPSGHKYVGEFKYGKFHGKGTATTADGTVVKGIFKKDKLVKELK